MKKVLTIAGSDSSGGAGIQADLKTMDALGVYGMSVICAVTAQNTTGVLAVQEIRPEIVRAQLKAVFEDIQVDAVKIGMVGSAEIIRVIREELVHFGAGNIVLDPVMVSTSGYHLLQEEALSELQSLMTIADLVTPNIPEAEVLIGRKVESLEDMEDAAAKIAAQGTKNILLKGGHRSTDAHDLLWTEGRSTVLQGARVDTPNTHGTGCTLSSAIASLLARGYRLEEAVRLGKEYLTEAIKNSLRIGRGAGPLGHLVNLHQRANDTKFSD